MTVMTPKEIVEKLDEHIIGQNAAKRAVAIALRNRWRRMQLDSDLSGEIVPKNILMIGPTGVGKTEIARRLAKLAAAPFLKVEATKFTEIGYVGRDVESIIRDLTETAVKMERESAYEEVRARAETAAEERILDALLPRMRSTFAGEGPREEEHSAAREIFRKKLRNHEIDEKEIEIEVSSVPIGVEIMAPPGMEEMTSQLQSMFQSFSGDRKRTKKMRILDAVKQLQEEESSHLVDEDKIRREAVNKVEQYGIVFIDEIDKLIRRENSSGADVSREGVQRDLLPLVEGCTVSTKHGMIRSNHILFIASGAFHGSKPSDLIPELQGRLPIRVELSALSPQDFVRILTEPSASLTKQYHALLGTEQVELQFTPDAIEKIAQFAWQVNEQVENIGARRLHTVMERLLEEISFEASEKNGFSLTIDAAYVEKHLADLVEDQDLRSHIL